MKIILTFILFFNLCGLCNAQSQSAAERLSDRLYEQSEIVGKIEENVLQMLQGSVSDHEYLIGNHAYDSAHNLDLYVTALLTLSTIYSSMRDNHDKMVVKRRFDTYCQATMKAGQASIEIINRNLPSIQSDALVNEITKMRDAISVMLGTLQGCKK